jgi:aspartyl/asparaginyl beta-hydroxylase (cupin superfamily)
MTTAEVNRLLQAAVAAQSAGRVEIARQHFEAVLKLAPDHAGALNSLGVQALARGDAAAALNWFSRAAAADPKAPALWINVAKAQRLLGDDEGERNSLTRVLEIDQRHFMGLIRLAELHERLGENMLAKQRWSGVLALGRLMEDRTPELEALLQRAAAFVADQNRHFAQAIDRGLQGERQSVSGRARRRFDACVDRELGRRAIYTNQCAGLHYPFLPADEFFDREHFSWMPALEARTAEIQAELAALLAEGDEGFRPYVKMDSGLPQNKWTELDNSLRWGAFFLWEYGQKYEQACARCPATAAALEAIPRQDIPGRAPSAFFSLLRPKTRIPPHTGVTNTRAIVHLPLVVPEGCGFRVGGETRQWSVGEAFAFDDTIEHEAWNDSDQLRAVLIFDVWNPHLEDDEKDLLRRFFSVADASGQLPRPSEGL